MKMKNYKTPLHEEEISKTLFRIIEFIGDDPTREGIIETPKRVIKSWDTIFGGYAQDPKDILVTKFASDEYDQMVILKNI